VLVNCCTGVVPVHATLVVVDARLVVVGGRELHATLVVVGGRELSGTVVISGNNSPVESAVVRVGDAI